MVNSFLNLRFWRSSDRQPERHVVTHRHVLESGIVLKYESDSAFLGRELAHILAEDPNGAGVRRLQTRDHSQEGRFPTSARAKQGGQRALWDIDRDIVKCQKALEPLRDADCFNSHLCHLLLAGNIHDQKR